MSSLSSQTATSYIFFSVSFTINRGSIHSKSCTVAHHTCSTRSSGTLPCPLHLSYHLILISHQPFICHHFLTSCEIFINQSIKSSVHVMKGQQLLTNSHIYICIHMATFTITFSSIPSSYLYSTSFILSQSFSLSYPLFCVLLVLF